ncbi:hypothetical protein Tco_1385647 [Tanacetum coccineum]
MVSVTIHQDTSAIPPMTSSVIDLISRPDSPNEHRPLPAIATATTTTTTSITTLPLPPQPQQSTTYSILIKRIVDKLVTDAVDWAIQAPLWDRLRDLPEADMKEILHHRMWETNSYKAHEDHKKLYEALEKSMDRDHSDQLLTDLAEARRKKKKRHDSPKTPPGSPPHQPHPPLPPVHSSDDEDIGNDHILKVNLKQDWWKPLPDEDRPATPEPAWSIPSSDMSVPMNNWASTLASTYAPPPENSLLAQTGDMAIFMDWYNVSKPLPLGGQPGKVTIQADFFFNKYLEYLRYGSKGGRPALSISKMKAACYPDVGLEQMVPDQMWIEEECKYDIAAIAVRTHMRILSVVRIEVFSLYGYDYMKTIVLRRADLNEYIIAERDFKYLYPSDFEDLYLLNLQGHLNHLPPQDKKILSTALNLTKPRWDATGFEFKHDFTVIDSPRAVTFRDKYGVQMIMRFNEIHKFSDGNLQQIDEALDYRFKEIQVPTG